MDGKRLEGGTSLRKESENLESPVFTGNEQKQSFHLICGQAALQTIGLYERAFFLFEQGRVYQIDDGIQMAMVGYWKTPVSD